MQFVCLIVLISFNVAVSTYRPKYRPTDSFYSWMEEQSISYPDYESELQSRIIFYRNRKLIDEHNQLFENCNSSYALGLWIRSDKTTEEINRRLNGLRVPQEEIASRTIYIQGIAIDTANVTFLNYTAHNIVTSVLDQGVCASCWAFAATGALESQIAKKENRLVKLSQQQLVDCDTSNYGCNGGTIGSAYGYIKESGIATYDQYPYHGTADNNCNYTSGTMFNATVENYVWQRIPSEKFLRDLLFSFGPISVGVDSTLFSFQNYNTGIYADPECSKEINHAMLLVGFGTDPAWGDYWILRNSYGTSWGENGYMRMQRGTNMCLIKNYVVFPIYTPAENI